MDVTTGRRKRAAPIALYIDPPTHHFLQDRLFDPATAPQHGDNILAPYIAIREKLGRLGIPVHTADLMPSSGNGTRFIYVSVGRIPDLAKLAARKEVTLSAFFAMECPIVEPTLYRDLPKVQRYVRRIFTFCDADQLVPFTRRPVALTGPEQHRFFLSFLQHPVGEVDADDIAGRRHACRRHERHDSGPGADVQHPVVGTQLRQIYEARCDGTGEAVEFGRDVVVAGRILPLVIEEFHGFLGHELTPFVDVAVKAFRSDRAQSRGLLQRCDSGLMNLRQTITTQPFVQEPCRRILPFGTEISVRQPCRCC